MRIAVDARELFGRPTGVGRYIKNILRVWQGMTLQHEVSLYSIEDRHSQLPPDLKRDVFRLRPVPLGYSGVRALWEQIELPRALRKDGADVFFSPAYSIPLLLPCPGVVIIHDISFEAHPEWFSAREGFRRRFLCSRSAKKAKLVITDSEFSKREIQGYYRIPPEKIRVLPTGIDPCFSRRPDPEEIPRARKEFSESGEIVLFVGSLFNRRHIPELLQAFALVNRQRPSAVLLLVGENRTFPRIDIEAVAAGWGIQSALRRRDYLDNAALNLLYRAADVFVFLSSYEGFGMTPLEAIFCGTPAVVSSTSSLKEIFEGRAALVNPEDPVEVAGAILRILENPEKSREKLPSQESLLAEFSWSKTAAEILKSLESIAEAEP
jgi:glycosyltransferase involved in cell wall biosynthesis